jgi:hypothetical protein
VALRGAYLHLVLGEMAEAQPGDPKDFRGLAATPCTETSPPPAETTQAEGLISTAYFFLPWFFTASIAAAAASGSR